VFESPVRLVETLVDLRAALGDRHAVVARVLSSTKSFAPVPLIDLHDEFAERCSWRDDRGGGDLRTVRGPIRVHLFAVCSDDGLKPSKVAREVAHCRIPGDEAYTLVHRCRIELKWLELSLGIRML